MKDSKLEVAPGFASYKVKSVIFCWSVWYEDEIVPLIS